MRTHQEMLKAGRLSVWMGNVTCEEELLSYVDDGAFGEDLDFAISPKLGRELKAEPQPISLEMLVQGFSGWREFGDPCVREAKNLGITAASSMVVLYAFEYVQSTRVHTHPLLTFIGFFDF